MFESINAILSTNVLQADVSVWLTFFGFVAFVLFLDLGVLNRKDHVVEVRESLIFSGIYILIACCVGIWVWNMRGAEDGLNFFTAYVVEQSLSLDNLFVMSLIFTYFGIPRMYQHRVLFWGIVGVVVMRGVMIGFGTALVHQFSWILLVFGAFLIFTGIKMFLAKDETENIEDNKALKFLQKHMNVTPFLSGNHFFVWRKSATGEKAGENVSGQWQATPLFLALVAIELADVLFAVDSVPAVLSITSDTFVVYTSNILAILGLRTMYFAVAALIHRFVYMKYSLSLILVLIGAKGFYNHFSPEKIPPAVSLSLTLGILIGGFVFSMFKTRDDARIDAAAEKVKNSDLLGP